MKNGVSSSNCCCRVSPTRMRRGKCVKVKKKRVLHRRLTTMINVPQHFNHGNGIQSNVVCAAEMCVFKDCIL